MDSVSGESNSAALIIQGTLIFLSAVVAIGGYYVQGRLKSKERHREIQIARTEELHRGKLKVVRDKMTRFVGPAHFLALTYNMVFFQLRKTLSELHPEEGKATTRQLEETGMGFEQLMKGGWSSVTASSFFGNEMMETLRKNPTSRATVHYRRIMAESFRKFAIPLAGLIEQFAGFLQEWQPIDDFKKTYPCAGVLARNEFPIQFLQFRMEFGLVVADWDAGRNLDVLWTEQSVYPFQIAMYLIRMMTTLRERENQEGMASHAVVEDGKMITTVPKSSINQFDGKSDKEMPTKNSKYVAKD